MEAFNNLKPLTKLVFSLNVGFISHGIVDFSIFFSGFMKSKGVSYIENEIKFDYLAYQILGALISILLMKIRNGVY